MDGPAVFKKSLLMCLSTGVQSGAGAGTSQGFSTRGGEWQRAGCSGERQQLAGDEPEEHRTLQLGQVRTFVHSGIQKFRNDKSVISCITRLLKHLFKQLY